MRKRILPPFFVFLAVMAGAPAAAFAGEKIILNHPIILVHGWAGSDVFLGRIPYFWHIREALEHSVSVKSSGQCVFTARGVDALNTDDRRAVQLRRFVIEIMTLTGAKRVNIVAHSQGGSTARCMAWAYRDMAKCTASITTVSTPHRGTSAAELLLMIDRCTHGVLRWFMEEIWSRFVCGNGEARFQESLTQLTREGMADFNRVVKNVPGVTYLSWGTMYRRLSPGFPGNVLQPFHCWMKSREGDNDGVVPLSSMPWGEYRGCEAGMYGVDHFMAINQLCGYTPGFDAAGFYVKIARLLAKRGL